MRGLDRCEGTLCSDVLEVKSWVKSEMAAQQAMMMCMMQEMVMLRKAIDRSRCAHRVEEKVVNSRQNLWRTQYV